MMKLIKRYLKKSIRNLKYRLGWRHCGKCRTFSWIRWVKDWVVDPDEPSMFYHWECSNCGISTTVQPTLNTEKAVRSLGFENFECFAKENLEG